MTIPSDKCAPEAAVHLVGSIPLQDSEAVFRAVANTLGGCVTRTPDGETGARTRWNSWTAPSYEATPGLEMIDPPEGSYTPWRQARLTIDPKELRLARLGYADAAIESYQVFARLKDEGVLPKDLRLQVCIPTPVAPMIILVEEGSRADVEPAVIRQLQTELDEILAAVPHEQLAIQWDVCQDVGIWEGFYEAYFDDPQAGVVERLRNCVQMLPADVPVGFHLCYGDFGHKHFMDPSDLGAVTRLANAVTAATDREIGWWHMPVPANRDDEAYFAPLADLDVRGAEVYLGLVHDSDGPEGTRRRMQTAARFLSNFGIATECGFGRRPVETVEPLMQLHADLARDIGATPAV